MPLARASATLAAASALATLAASCVCTGGLAVKSDKNPASEARPAYPASPAGPVVDTLHGQSVADPYRWLEPDDDARVQQWTADQNAFTSERLDRFPHRAALRGALDDAFDIGWLGPPEVAGGQAFWMERRGDWNQAHLLTRPVDGNTPARTLIDGDALSEDGTTAVDWFYPSRDGQWLAYGLSTSGSEDSVLHVMRVSDGTVEPTRIPGTRHASVTWLPDGSGFYYSRYPVAGSRYWPTVAEGQDAYHRQIYLHRTGSDPLQDERIFGEGLDREDWTSVASTPSGEHLVAAVSMGWAKTSIYARPAADGAEWRVVASRPDTRDEPLPTDEALLVFSNHEAPRGKVLRMPWSADARIEDAAEIVPEHPVRVMRSVAVLGGRLVISWLHEASSRLTVHQLDGTLVSEVPLHGIGTVDGLGGDCCEGDIFYAFSSFTVPPRVERLPVDGGPATVFAAVEGQVDAADYEVSLERAVSRDGTPVTMFVTHAKGLVRSSDAPTVLYGYGGFNHALTPSYTRNIQPFLAAGGIYVVAHLRGGGEYGEAWHQAGMLGNKDNVFDDFEAAAEFLVTAGYTRPERLAVMGGSNGGLLTGAASVRFPERFRAAVVRVPLLDMLRYHLFLIARLWIAEYGDPDDAEAFEWLRAYSPYHNVPEPYVNPAVFLLAAESDTRVAPLHARKFGALLQTRATTARPILVRIETEAGHGAGKPTSKMVDEYADIWTFLWQELGISATP